MIAKKDSFARKKVMIWQTYGATQNMLNLEKRGKVDKKVTKTDAVGAVTTKKSDATQWEWPFWCWIILLYFLWVYLLILLAFYETNKPSI